MGTPANSNGDGPECGGPAGSRRFWRRDFVGFAVGVWVSTAGSVVLASTRAETPRTWSYEPGVLIGVFLVAPFVAALLTILFKMYLAFRVGDGAGSEDSLPIFPFGAGLACVPACLVVVYVLPKTPADLYEMTAMIVFLALPVVSAELYFQLVLSRKHASRERPARSRPKR